MSALRRAAEAMPHDELCNFTDYLNEPCDCPRAALLAEIAQRDCLLSDVYSFLCQPQDKQDYSELRTLMDRMCVALAQDEKTEGGNAK